MLRWALVAGLIAHGIVHMNVWGSASMAEGQGTDIRHSWLLGDRRAAAVVLMSLTAVLFTLSAIGLVLAAEWWGGMTVAAAATSLVLVALFPGALLNAWLLAPIAINVGLIIGVIWFSWPSREVFGG